MLIRKKKKGSSLMMVIVIFSILSVLGTSILAMTSNDYYRRITETKKLQNLYGAESGLDNSYNIISQNFADAVIYANKAVYAKYEDNSSSQYWGRNPEFKKLDGSIDYRKYEEAQNNEFKEQFKLFVTCTLKKCIDESKRAIYRNGTFTTIDPIAIDTTIDFMDMAKIDNAILDSSISEDENKIIIDVVSEFTENGGEKRKIKSKYTMEIPQYETYTSHETLDIHLNPIFDKVIAIDGDMKIKEDTNIVKGDVFVNGTKADSISNVLYDKYKGGIEIIGTDLTDDGKTIFNVSNGTLVTGQSIKIGDYSTADFSKDVFASSIALGKSKDSLSTFSYSNLNAYESVYLSNDLSLNGENLRAEIKNFYGINDLNVTKKDIDSNEQNKAIKSSSIIINSEKSSTVEISNEAYIWGTAYINAQDSNGKYYQTGESVAIKGNYLAYTDSLGEDVEFDYYNSLYLISKFNGKDVDDLVFNKADHIKAFNNANSGVLNVNTDTSKTDIVAVKLPENTYSAGAYIAKTSDGKNTIKSNYQIDKEDEVKSKQAYFANQVLFMGKGIELGHNNEELKNNFPFVQSGVEAINVENAILFGSLIEKDEIDNSGNIVYFNKDDDDIYKLVGSNDPLNPKKISGLIITKGNVVISGYIEFTGAIIAKGNIDVNKIDTGITKGNIKITHDEDIVKEIVKNNYRGNLENVIKDYSISGYQHKLEISTSLNDLESQFNPNSYIKKGTWSIENN